MDLNLFISFAEGLEAQAKLTSQALLTDNNPATNSPGRYGHARAAKRIDHIYIRFRREETQD